MFKKITVTGCSFSAGIGLELRKKDPENYANIVSKYFDASCKNIAVSGNNNQDIFIASTEELLYNTPDLLIVQWSGIKRIKLSPSPFIDDNLSITNYKVNESHLEVLNSCHDKIFTNNKKEFQWFLDKLFLLNGEIQNIVNLTRHSNILESLAKNSNCKVLFVNGLAEWSKDLVNYQIKNFYSELSDYTKSLIDLDTRSDDEIIKILDNLQSYMKTVNFDLWLNPFNSFRSMMIDKGDDNAHPGPKSHALYADNIINYLTKRYE